MPKQKADYAVTEQTRRGREYPEEPHPYRSAFERDRELSFDRVSVGALLYLAIAGSAVTFSLYYWLLSHLPAKRLALIAYIIPLIAVLIGVLRDEPLTLRSLIGSALVLVGVALAIHRPS